MKTPPQAWISKTNRLLLRMKAAVQTAQAAGQTELSAELCSGFEAAYTLFLNEGLRANAPPKRIVKRRRPMQTPARNQLDRLATHRGTILAFVHDFRVPFDNKQAERDLRMLTPALAGGVREVKGKVSGCIRSPKAADPASRAAFATTFRRCASQVIRSPMA